MILEYYKLIREYFKVSELKKQNFILPFIIKIIHHTCALLAPLVVSWIIKYLEIGDAGQTYFYLYLFFSVVACANIALYIDLKVFMRNASYSYCRMQTTLLNKLLSVDSNFTRKIDTGRLMNSIDSDVLEVSNMSDNIVNSTVGILQILAIFVIVAFHNVYLAIILVISFIVTINIQNRMNRKENIHYRKVVIQDDKYSNLLSQVISGLQEIKTLNILEKFRSKLDVIQQKFIKEYTSMMRYFTYRDNDIRALQYTFRFALYIILIWLMSRGDIGISLFVLVIAYHSNIVRYSERLITETSTIREISVSVDRINEILNYNSENPNFGSLDFGDINGNIEFQNVSLSIANEKILQNINLKIKHHEIIAIVGESGAGKTMLFNLILRLIKPSSGKIKIDNTNIFEFSNKAYARNVSIVNQKPFIFNMSIRRNLDFVDTDIKRQIEACKRVRIHDFIETLPDGYNTILRENATNISGGQKQMISIARTILTDAEILLLDDITTALDPDTVKIVPHLVKNLKKDRTIVMITKKPMLMDCADRIIVLDRGKVVGDGTHKQLIKNNEIYQILYARKSPSNEGGEI